MTDSAYPPTLTAARQNVARPAARRAVDRLQRLVCDEARARILQALSAGPLSVRDIASVIERRPAATSQHLRILREQSLVTPERRGTSVIYRLSATPEAQHALAALAAFERAA